MPSPTNHLLTNLSTRSSDLGAPSNRKRFSIPPERTPGSRLDLTLLSHVRGKVGEAHLVVAIISPAFQTRPVCTAELGAAWSRVDNLFPLAVPGMERTDMEGVLKGMVVRYLDESAALDELHDRIGDAVGRRPNATTWGKYKAKWLASVSRLTKALPPLKVAGLPELERLESDLEAARSALEESEGERAELLFGRTLCSFKMRCIAHLEIGAKASQCRDSAKFSEWSALKYPPSPGRHHTSVTPTPSHRAPPRHRLRCQQPGPSPRS